MGRIKDALGGFAIGIVNALFGAGGGMILVPMLTRVTDLEEESIFPASVSIILPICIVSLLSSFSPQEFSLRQTLPYLIGSIVGGIAAGVWGQKIPTKWLHRFLGSLILWGGLRYLW